MKVLLLLSVVLLAWFLPYSHTELQMVREGERRFSAVKIVYEKQLQSERTLKTQVSHTKYLCSCNTRSSQVKITVVFIRLGISRNS